MKKLVAMMTIALAVTSAGFPVSAAEEKSVWINTSEAVLENDQLKVSVQSNGEVTDGLLELKYDADVLSITESEIAMNENVAMYSVNVENETVKIAFLSEDAMEEGAFVTLNFNLNSETTLEDAKKALENLTGTNYKEDGSVIPESEVGIISSANDNGTDGGDKEDPSKPDEGDKDDTSKPGTGDKEDKDDTSKPGTGDKNDKNDSSDQGKNDSSTSKPSGGSGSQTNNSTSKTESASGSQNTATAGTSAKTGDHSQILIPVVLAAAAAGVFGVTRYWKKGEEKNEV